MHILGLCNGSQGGNTEILLRIALSAAQESTIPETTTSWIHVPSLVIPKNALPLKGTMQSLIKGDDSGSGPRYNAVDDRQAFKNAVMDADAIIVASATHNRQPPGALKVIMDQIGGLESDAAAALERKASGDTELDERVLKPRSLAFIATGGSRTSDQYSQVLPALHLFFRSLHAKVIDQYVAKGFLASGAVLADASVVDRAKTLGRNVASQLGKSFEKARYLGPEEEGSCPYCHLDALELSHAAGINAVGCVTCGAKGKLVAREDGKILPEWEQDSAWSCQTMKGRKKHNADFAVDLAEEKAALQSREDLAEQRASWLNVEIEVESLPSHAAEQGLRDG